MGLNPRIYFRSVQKMFLEENPIFIGMIQLQKILQTFSVFWINSKYISKNINERQNKLDSAKKIINARSPQNNSSHINLLR